MFKQATSIASRLRARTIFAPTARTLPLPLNVEAARAQLAPTQPLPDHTPVQPPQDRSTHPLPQMITFSAFDPCASRPLLMSGLSLGPDNWQPGPNSYPEQTKPVVREQRKPPTDVTRPVKPWPYSLPRFLQPQPGTTYQAMYDSAARAPKRVGVWQALLYGVPDPNNGVGRGDGDVGMGAKKGGLVEKVVYGAKEGGGV
jgi:hypothetical protein